MNSKGKYTIYIHGTDDGQKAHALDQETVIGFETDGGHEDLRTLHLRLARLDHLIAV